MLTLGLVKQLFGESDESADLARQERHSVRHGTGSQDRARARRHHQGHRLRHLRLGPASVRRRHAHRWKRATSSATRPWAKSSRSARENKKLKVGDRVVVPFTISCGECFFCKKGFFSGCERSNPNHKMAEKLWGHSPAGLFGYSHMLGGYRRRPGGVSARALCRCRPDQGAAGTQR